MSPRLVYSTNPSDSDHREQKKPVKFDIFADYMSTLWKQISVGQGLSEFLAKSFDISTQQVTILPVSSEAKMTKSELLSTPATCFSFIISLSHPFKS